MRILLDNAIIVTGASSDRGAVVVNGERIERIYREGAEEQYGNRTSKENVSGAEGPGNCAAEEAAQTGNRTKAESVEGEATRGKNADGNHGSGPEGHFDEVIDLGGKVLMAGAIDAHVHFREPGLTHKADMSSESYAAMLGGVTSFVDMPNTTPPTISAEALKAKIAAAKGRCYANYGFHIGATNGNVEAIAAMAGPETGTAGANPESHATMTSIENQPLTENPEPPATTEEAGFGGVKVFMGSSTGNMLVDNEAALDILFRLQGHKVLIHSEDEGIIKANLAAAKEHYGDHIPFEIHPLIRSREACIKSTAKALEMAIKYGTKLHVLHVTTAEEVEMIRAAKLHNHDITAETSANYLWFYDEDYGIFGGRIKCNPAIKTAKDRTALRRALADGTIDTIGSDHAPHLISEKGSSHVGSETSDGCISGKENSKSLGAKHTDSKNSSEERGGNYLNCPSGMPSIQQSLSVILTVAREEGIGLNRIASVMSERAAEIFNIKDRGVIKEGAYADLVAIDPEADFTVGENRGISSSEGVDYKCGWSPYEGTRLTGAIKMVMVNGNITVRNGQILDNKPYGKSIFPK